MRPGKASLVIPVLLALLSTLAFAVQPDRISGAIDSSQMVALGNHVPPMARPQDDRGPVQLSRQLNVTMLFTPSDAQRKALLKLLTDQQNPKSVNYHKWLTSDQYGERFGLSQGDIERIKDWLTAQGLKITYVAHGRDFVSFQGNAEQVQNVFKTEIHNYSVEGKTHFANATPPLIPAALSGIVGGFRGLHDFAPHSMLRKHSDFTVSGQPTHYLAPGDLATIYDINPLYQASTPIDGTGQKVVIAAQSDVYLADLNDYRTAFGFSSISGCSMDSTKTIIKAGSCSSGNFQMVVPGTGVDPGVRAGDLGESDLDIEIMSSIARKAQIIFVTSAPSSGGVDDSASWAIDQNPPLAHVISYSYGLCEAFVTAPSITTAESVYSKAASEGISFFAASGDAGSATCDGDANPPDYPAILGPSVSYPASSVNVTAVGGTEFNEGGGNFWSTTNGADGGSAMSYIPEIGWNDTVLSAKNGNGLDATGGGPSNCAFGSGMTTVDGFSFEICDTPPNGGFPKPAWQSGITPNDKVRDVPDISFSASNANDPYIICTPQSEIGGTGTTSTCASGITAAINAGSAFGGTSASTPLAAGMAVLLNQFLGTSGLGNLNPQLYGIYSNGTAPFHDITAGTNSATGGTSDNIVPCTKGTPSFEPAALQCPSTGKMGFSASAGYDLVTGLGTIDIDKFFSAWPSFVVSATTVSPASISAGNSATGTLTVTTQGTFSGKVAFSGNSCSNLPSGATCSFNPASVTPGGMTTLTIATAPNTATVSSQVVTIAGTSAGVSKTTTVTLTVTPTTEKFALAASPATLSLQPGETTANTVNLAVSDPGNTGFIVNNQTVIPLSYTCSVTPAASEGPTCTFSPSAGQNVSILNPTVAIVTIAPTTKLYPPFKRRGPIFYAMLLPGVLGIALAAGSRPRSLRLLTLVTVLGFSTLWLSSCGGSSNTQKNPGTPPGSYKMTVNATTGGASPLTSSASFTVTVQ